MLILRFSSKVDIMTFFITKNNSIPFMKKKKCLTGADNLRFCWYYGLWGWESKPCDNNLLGSFKLSSLPTCSSWPPSWIVCFNIDENGTLIVSAYEKSTGGRNTITITNDKERLSSQEIIKMIKEAENYHIEDDKFLRKAVVMNGLDLCVYKIKNALEKKGG